MSSSPPTGSSPAASGVPIPDARVRTLSQSGDSTGSPSSGAGFNAARRRRSSFGTFTRTVVVAVDVSDHSRNAFEWYLANLWRADDLIILAHCPEPPRLPSFTFKSGLTPPVEEWKKIMDEMNASARKLEEDFEGTCALKRLKFKSRTEAAKNVGEGLLRIAEEEIADLIVCGSRGGAGGATAAGGRKGSTFKGSTCDFIMRNSSMPIVVVPFACGPAGYSTNY